MIAAGLSRFIISNTVNEHSVQGMLYSAVFGIVSLLLASVQCVLKVPDHTTRRSERTGSLHERVDRRHERVVACRDALSLALVQRVGLKPECENEKTQRDSERADREHLAQNARSAPRVQR